MTSTKQNLLDFLREHPGCPACEMSIPLRLFLKELENNGEIYYDGDGWYVEKPKTPTNPTTTKRKKK